jgi:hypothetical protein
MGFGRAPTGVCFLDDRALRLRRKADEGGARKVRRPAELDEVGPFVEIRANRRPDLLGGEVDQVFADAL